MEIEKWTSTSGPFIKFKAYAGTPCKLSVAYEHLKITLHSDRFMPDYAQFSQEDIKTLLPYLQSFAETCTLEPHTKETFKKSWKLEDEGYGPVSFKNENGIHEYHDNLIQESIQLVDRALDKIELGDTLSIEVRVVAREPATEPPTLQGEDQEERFGNLAKSSAKRVLDIFEDQKKRIEALVETTARMNYRNYRYEQLLKEWKKFGQPSSDSKSPDELVHLTDEIVRESALSVEGVNAIEKANRGKEYYKRQCDKQVDEIADLEEQIEIMQESGVAMAANIADQGNRIEALEQLLRKWRAFGMTKNVKFSAEWADLDSQTRDLLGDNL
jgi:hypothetical protein